MPDFTEFSNTITIIQTVLENNKEYVKVVEIFGDNEGKAVYLWT